MTANKWSALGIILWVVMLIVIAVVTASCDWNQQTEEKWNAEGQRVYRRYTNMGSIGKESLIENGSMISEPNYFEIVVEHAELKTSEVNVKTVYGTIGVNND